MAPPFISLGDERAPDVLGEDEIVVVHRPLEVDDAELARLAATLSAGERAKAARYVFERDRRRAVVSRGSLRALLGRLLAREPASLELREGAQGKPALAGAERLRFNVSHAADHLYLALSWDRELGVDVEGGSRPLEVQELAPVVFTLVERRELEAYAPEEQRGAFLRAWTRKEAYLKARSVGLSLPLQHFSVSLAREVEVSLVSSVDPVEAARFLLIDLPAPDEHAAALAWTRAGSAVRRVRVLTPGLSATRPSR